MIRHQRHNEIDKAAWDARLLRCANKLWYAQSWVLDLACPGWEALIDDDSGAMMPLTCRRKWGIDYLYQPLGLQQLGLFAPVLSGELCDRFLDAVPARFRYVDIALNEAMIAVDDDGTLSLAINQVLSATSDNATMRASYSTGHRRNLKEAGSGMVPAELDVAGFEALFRRTTGARFGASAVKGLSDFMAVVHEGMKRGQCSIAALSDEHEVAAAACFATWEGRSILLKSANTEAGHRAKAMFRITDDWIERHASTGTLLDFAGSNTPSVARFNEGFGAVTGNYFRLRRNRLPLLARWLKN